MAGAPSQVYDVNWISWNRYIIGRHSRNNFWELLPSRSKIDLLEDKILCIQWRRTEPNVLYHCLVQLRGFSVDCILRIQRLDRLLPHAGRPRRYHTCPEVSSQDEGDESEGWQEHGRHHLPYSMSLELVIWFTGWYLVQSIFRSPSLKCMVPIDGWC